MARHFSKALIVDDESLLILTIFAAIQQISDVVVFAKSLEFAEAMIAQSKPDLLILDNYLSDGEGIDFCKKIKSDPNLKDIFVIFFSGADDKVMEALANGADLAFNKSVSMQDVLTHL